MQIKLTASLLLALGFLSGIVWLFASRADAQMSGALQAAGGGPPGPRSMVVFDSMPASGGSPAVTIPAHGSISLLTIPMNRWLVVTDYDQSNGMTVDLVEDLAGVVTVKRHEFLDFDSNIDRFHSAVGLAFAPGSHVVMRNHYPAALQVTYHLAGYWVIQ